ncbi:MAG: GH32 C-terminal domain-containing protein, partial [Planctomycetales bacterium]|nr:GH32 C-terminal domain-containing protein [Planctomycetales bacterium]
EGRPVVENQGFDHEERDPKVFWHEPAGRWIMALWVQVNPGRVRFFTSKNLVDCEFASDLLRDWAFECMDAVVLPIDGDPSRQRLLLYDASFVYEVGTFDGREFHTEFGPFQAGGGNFYAAQTFYNEPRQRAVQIGWMRGGPNSAEKYGAPFNQQMSFPCELTLRTVGDDVRVFAGPVPEIESLWGEQRALANVALLDGVNVLEGESPLDLVDAEIVFDPGDAERIEVRLAGAELAYDCANQRLTLLAVNDRGDVEVRNVFEGLEARDGMIELRILVDRLSVEVYAFGGEKFHAAYIAPNPQDAKPKFVARGGAAQLERMKLRRLRSAWEKP